MVKNDATFKVRLPSDLLVKAQAKADREDVPLAQVIRHFLMEWAKDEEEQMEKP